LSYIEKRLGVDKLGNDGLEVCVKNSLFWKQIENEPREKQIEIIQAEFKK